MSTAEIKSEIQHVLDNVPENVLEDILIYAKQLQTQFSEESDLLSNLDKVLSENKGLLARLAK